MLVTIHSAALNGLEAIPVLMEVQTGKCAGETPCFSMVGLPDNAVRESRLRVESALFNCGYHSSSMNVTVNLAPADVRKEGTGYDFPLAMGLIASMKAVDAQCLQDCMFVGELGLDGSVRPLRGILPIAIMARERGYGKLFVPVENSREAAVVNRLEVYGVSHIREVVNMFNGTASLSPVQVDTRAEFARGSQTGLPDFSEVKGQENVKRALEVAAAGGHNLIMVGSPGCGKSMMAKRLLSILPDFTLGESLETTKIHSIAGKIGAEVSLLHQRPFRNPHHSISDVALIGGGVQLQPGEISLAHNGVLFLDELPEFSRAVLETMRQPLEERCITISRAKYSVTLPCSFMCVAAMNPCPCGYYGHPTRSCTCSPGQIHRYLNKISGPLLDRIDIQVEVTPVPVTQLGSMKAGEPSAVIKERVMAARAIQTERYRTWDGIFCNAQMTEKMIQQYCLLDEQSTRLLHRAMERLQLSARAYSRILKVARTIADLSGSENILSHHISEAVSYRNLDRGTWGE